MLVQPGNSGKKKKGRAKKAQPLPMPEPELIGAIKIKDGLFIGDELAAQVSHLIAGLRICSS